MFDLAKKEAYGPLEQENLNDVSLKYRQHVFENCKKLIALAGYRLADILEDVYSEKPQTMPSFKVNKYWVGPTENIQ